MISKVILRGQNYVLLTLSVIGAAFGMFLIMLCLQLYLDFTGVLNNPEDDLLSPQYLVVNKQVSMLGADDPRRSQFTPSEIAELEALDAVDEVAAFKPNQFRLKAFMDGEGMPPLYTDLFFESIPDEFIDVDPAEWEWVSADSVVPIIVPKDYISLYNFGFAPSQGMPKVSENAFKLVQFNLKISGKGKKVVIYGRIAGFSDRINSVLVPMDFLEEYNEAFSDNVEVNPSRLVLSTRNASDPELFKFLEEQSYVTNNEQLKGSKINGILQAILSIMLVIGGIIVMLSINSFVMYSQVIIQRAAYEVRVLIEIGYNYLKISRVYVVMFAVIMAVVSTLSYFGVILGRDIMLTYVTDFGFDVGGGIASQTYVVAALFIVIYFVINILNILLVIRKIAKPQR